MDDLTFTAFLELLMCSDPWPISTIWSEKVIKDFANEQSKLRGFSDWIDAYHNWKGF